MNDNAAKTSSDDSLKSAASHYDMFLGPIYFEHYAVEIVKRIIADKACIVLELAAGTGRVTRHVREAISPLARLIASDVSEDMLAVAKRKLSRLAIDWQKIDARQLPFGDNSVDLVICGFGYMFVPDRSKAFAEAYRVLKPGGLLLFSTWDKLESNGLSYTAVAIAREYVGEEQLPGSYLEATSMSDATEIRSLLKDAGFTKISIEKAQLSALCQTAKEAASGLTKGPFYQHVKKLNPARIDEIQVKLENELAGKYGAAPMIAPMSALISQAWK